MKNANTAFNQPPSSTATTFEMTPPFVWQPISNMAFLDRHVLFYWDDDEKSRIETATVVINHGVWSYWTRGGPNGGEDWEAEGQPKLWMKILDPAPTIVIAG